MAEPEKKTENAYLYCTQFVYYMFILLADKTTNIDHLLFAF